MVYCTKCGAQNEDHAATCSKCGASLLGPPISPYAARQPRRAETECFGLPHGGLIVGLIVGIIIILVGVSSIYGLDWGRYLWQFIILIIGVLIVAGALYSLSRR